MLSVLKTLLSKINWTALVGTVVGIAGIVFGMFRNEQAKTATAQADQKVARKDAEVATQEAKATERKAEAVQNAAEAVKETKAIPDDELDKEGAEMGILRKD